MISLKDWKKNRNNSVPFKTADQVLRMDLIVEVWDMDTQSNIYILTAFADLFLSYLGATLGLNQVIGHRLHNGYDCYFDESGDMVLDDPDGYINISKAELEKVIDLNQRCITEHCGGSTLTPMGAELLTALTKLRGSAIVKEPTVVLKDSNPKKGDRQKQFETGMMKFMKGCQTFSKMMSSMSGEPPKKKGRRTKNQFDDSDEYRKLGKKMMGK